MQWSRAYLPKEIAEQRVLDFVPKKIELGAPQAALEYLERKPGTDFRLSEAVSSHTGVAEIERQTHDESVEEKAVSMLGDIQEKAYQEAYQLGLEEGRTKAFQEVASEITQKMSEFTKLISALENIKKEVLAQNEAHLVKLMYHMASRLSHKEMQQSDDSLVDIIRSAVSLAQDEENVRVSVAPAQFEFVEELKKQTGREFEFLKKIRFEPNPDVTSGGCIVETNYGEVDARIEQRIDQLWTSLSDLMPKVKDKVTG